MQPRILLSHKADPGYYVAAVTHCGAIAEPHYLPEISADYDGLILCGGSDMDPAYFGQAEKGAVNIDRERDQCEIALAKAFIAAKKPILGICRGHQLLNVLLGGTLHQHIPTAEAHRTPGDAVHCVVSVGEGVLSRMYGRQFSVNSHHHQAVDRLGEGLRITQLCPEDGTVEAFEHESLPILGVQWHPERMCLTQTRPDTVNGLAVFRHFTDLCRNFRKE